MISLIKREWKGYLGSPLIFLIIIFLLYSYAERQETNETYEIYLLRVLTYYHLLIFCMIPVFLLSIYRNLSDDLSYVLIRFTKFASYFYTKWLGIFMFSAFFVALQVITVCLVGIGLPIGNYFSESLPAADTLFQTFKNSFSTPLATLIYSSVYMVAGLSFVGITITTLYHFFDRRFVVILIMFVYLVMIVGLKIEAIGNLPFITMNRYIILHHNIIMPNGVLWSITGMISLTFIQSIIIQKAWHWKETGK
ncbi:hypothetical protein F9U64_07975 [Gracilibacillus oryzae]|uniref:Uncharacterized protein n=1 Tax=Gracilibacillus oryzae TaxID=1672701 RepID=A0A7C8GUM8_9BACI|nr:hypothetical protein [Gracilibacillus oryzae]KAB8137734.1 hypothetical protein F9U64_07975 [Gracilibacillus oryzae]